MLCKPPGPGVFVTATQWAKTPQGPNPPLTRLVKVVSCSTGASPNAESQAVVTGAVISCQTLPSSHREARGTCARRAARTWPSCSQCRGSRRASPTHAPLPTRPTGP